MNKRESKIQISTNRYCSTFKRKATNVILQFFTTMFIALLGAISFSSQATESRRVVVEHWPPWELALDEKKLMVSDGIAIKLLAEIMKRINEPMVLVTTPWARALAEIESGRSDIIPMVAKTEDRQKYMLFTVPIYKDNILLAYSEKKFGTFNWENWEELKDYTFQLVRGYDYGVGWRDAHAKYNYQYEYSTSDEQSLIMLYRGRIDLVPLFYVNGSQLIRDLKYSEVIKFAPKTVKETIFYFGVSKKSSLALRIDDINRAIESLKTDGTYNDILSEL